MTLPEHLIAENEHGRYCVPMSSKARPAAAFTLEGRVWEPRTIALMAANCASGDIVHAGTYFGDFLPALSRALAPGARLWAFEPSYENHACAEETIALNGLANVSLFRAALGARAGSATLRTASPRGKALGGSSMIVAEGEDLPGAESVPVVALDDVAGHDRHVSVLQLDVEGYEQKALRGARRILKRCQPLLILESLPQSERWYERNILALGYRALGTVHGNTVLCASADDLAGFGHHRDTSPRVARRVNRDDGR